MEQFQLQPPKEKLQELADRYVQNKAEMERETLAFDAGARIRQRKSTDVKGDLETIVKWKSPRSVHYICENSTEEVQAAIDAAISKPENVQEAVSALTKLTGVGLPVASAILTTIFPDQYTVIDFRALEALGHDQAGVEFYRQYLEHCKSLAKSLGESSEIQIQSGYPAETELRVLDRALWQWSASKGKLEPE
ncbi:MAG: hypothetical protein ABSG60_00640 [Terracidiphilus sp.]